MIIPHFRSIAALASAIATVALASPAGNFRLVSPLNGYQSPSDLLEGTPGLFYASATLGGTSQNAALSITNQGVTTVLATLPNMYNLLSGFVGGPNGRFYSSVEYSSYPGYIFSITPAQGSGHSYPPQTFTPVLHQGLPDAKFLATGGGGSAGNLFLLRGGTDGTVTPIYQYPPKVRPLSAIYGSDGNYYGIVATANSSVSYVFRVTPSGFESSLHNFAPNSFSTWDPAPLVQGPNGDFYGALPTGGTNHSGLIFRLTLSGTYTVLYTFGTSDKGGPAALIQASDGNLYGAAINYGGNSYLFRVAPSGQYTMLYSMSPSAGGICNCSLTQGSDGVIYGTSAAGGPHGDGTVFAWDAGLPKPKPQPLQFRPQSGPVGTQVRIWGYNLLAPAVEFNGTPATAVTSSGPQYVLATVPASATSGPITVTTPGGASTTQAVFTVQ